MNIFQFKKLKEKFNSYIKTVTGIAGENKQVVKMTGFAVGIIVCSVILGCFFTSAYEVYMDGEKVAVVEEKADFQQGLSKANAQITALAGKGFEINKTPKFVFTVIARNRISDDDKIIDAVMSRSNIISKACVIKVDGYDIATAKNEEEALNLVNKAAMSYGSESIKVLNSVETENRYVLISRFTNDDLAVKLLKNVLTVQTEKTAVYQADLMHGTVTNPSEDMYVNEEKLLAQGQTGVMKVTAKVTEINGAVAGTEVLSTEVIKEPVDEVIMVGTTALPTVGTGKFIQPYFGTITSRFGARWGRTHTGTDIRGTLGDPIKAADTGIVITAEYQDNGYGNIIIIDHQNGVQTWYAHLDSIGVKAGDAVEKGAVIGRLGSTGYSTGPHLHFEVRENGTPVDPGKYLE